MARENAPLYALNAGEVSKNTLARADVAKMRLAAQCQVNWMPWVVGPMMLRPGLLHVGEVLNDSPCRPLAFVYAKTDTALIELTANVARIWINEALLTRVAVGTTVSDPNFAGGGSWSTAATTAGCTATISGGVCTLTATAIGGLAQISQTLTIALGDRGKEHGLRIVVTDGPINIQIGSAAGLDDYLSLTAIDTGTHSLVFTPTAGSAFLQIWSTDNWSKTLTSVSIEGAGVVQLPTTWGACDLANVRIDQSADIVYAACYGQQQRMLQRRGTRPGARGWSFVLYRSSDGPFHGGADSTVSLAASACYGNTTIVASGPFFQPGHVGALLRLFTPQQNVAAIIGAANAFTPPIEVTGVSIDREFDFAITGAWSGSWSLERSLTGPDGGFEPIASGDTHWVGGAPTFTSNGTFTFADAPDYNNVTAWYRVGFAAGNYTSGSMSVQCGYNSGGQFGIARVLTVNSPLQVTVEVLSPFSSIQPTTVWQISD